MSGIYFEQHVGPIERALQLASQSRDKYTQSVSSGKNQYATATDKASGSIYAANSGALKSINRNLNQMQQYIAKVRAAAGQILEALDEQFNIVSESTTALLDANKRNINVDAMLSSITRVQDLLALDIETVTVFTGYNAGVDIQVGITAGDKMNLKFNVDATTLYTVAAPITAAGALDPAVAIDSAAAATASLATITTGIKNLVAQIAKIDTFAENIDKQIAVNHEYALADENIAAQKLDSDQVTSYTGVAMSNQRLSVAAQLLATALKTNAEVSRNLSDIARG